MTVLLHANHGMTELWIRAALEVGYSAGETFVVASRASDRAVAEKWVPRGNVLFTGRSPRFNAAAVAGPALSSQSARALGNDRTLEDLLLGDRYLRGRPTALAVQWVNETVERYRDLVDRVSPDFAFGESTTASEILLGSVARNVFGLTYVTPGTGRIPTDRFGLWENDKLLTRPDLPGSREGREFLRRWVANPDPPSYFHGQSDRRGGVEGSLFEWVSRRLNAHVMEPARISMQRYTLREQLTLPWGNRFRRGMNARRIRQESWSPVPSSPYVLYPLHVQPEASVDNWPGQWRDQVATANFMADALGERGVTLVVKDHPNFIWNRPAGFHSSFQSNVVLVEPTVPTKDLAGDAISTFTISGTISLECGLLGRPAVVVAPLPWASLPTVQRVEHRDDIAHSLVESAGLAPKPEAVAAWYERYWSATWPGTILDPSKHVAVLGDSNVRLLADALRHVRDGELTDVF